MYYTKIKGNVIDLNQVLYYLPSNFNAQHTIYFHFKKGDSLRITFESKLERDFYLKELDDEVVEWNIDQRFKDKFEIEIDEI